jgi:hypothetical protein
MKPWKMLAGLALAGIMVSGAFAQQPGGGGGRGGRGGGMFAAPPAYDAIVSADVGVKDNDPITAAVIRDYMKKNLPADAPEGASANLDVAAVTALARVVKAAGQDPTKVVSLNKDDYVKGHAALPAGRGGSKKKKAPADTSTPSPN